MKALSPEQHEALVARVKKENVLGSVLKLLLPFHDSFMTLRRHNEFSARSINFRSGV